MEEQTIFDNITSELLLLKEIGKISVLFFRTPSDEGFTKSCTVSNLLRVSGASTQFKTWSKCSMKKVGKNFCRNRGNFKKIIYQVCLYLLVTFHNVHLMFLRHRWQTDKYIRHAMCFSILIYYHTRYSPELRVAPYVYRWSALSTNELCRKK